MKKQFVTYEIAWGLKGLGFDEPCLAFLDGYNGGEHFFLEVRGEPHWLVKLFYKKEKVIELNQDHLEYLEGDNAVLAPMWQQAIDFLREKCDIHIELQESRTKNNTEYEWWFYLYFGHSGRVKYFPDEIGKYLTFQQAREKAVLKAIEVKYIQSDKKVLLLHILRIFA